MPEIDAEYAAFIAGPRTRAKQLEMLETDVLFAMSWIDEMTRLVDEELPDAQFIERHLDALAAWTRARKLAQSKIRYRFNPARRPRHLIERDTNRAIERTRAQLETLRARLADASADARERVATPDPHPKAERRARPRPALPETPLAATRPPAAAETSPRDVNLHPNLQRIDPSTLAMYTALAPDLDIATTPDTDLRRAWEDAGWDEERINAVLRHLNDLTYRPPWMAHR